MDIVFIRDLRVDTIVGIYDWERKIRQTVSLDIELGTDIARAAASDDIADTLNYKAIAKNVSAFVEAQSFQLVETLAEHVAQHILSHFDVTWLKLSLAKPGAVRGSQSVGIIIERGVRG